MGVSYVAVFPESIEVEGPGAPPFVIARVSEIRLLEPDRVRPEPTEGRMLGKFLYKTSSGGDEEFRAGPIGPHQVRNWRRSPYPFVYRTIIPDGNSYGGTSPALAAGDAITALAQLGELHKNQLKNGTHSSLIFKMLTESDNPERFHQAVALLKAGISQAGEPIIIPKDRFEIEKNPATNSEMQYQDLSDVSRKELLAVLGGSDSLVGLVESVSRANLWAQEWALATGTVDPLNDLIAASFSASVLPLYPGQSSTASLKMTFETSAFRDAKDDADVAAVYVGAGIKTRNEAREEIGLAKHPDGEGLGEQLQPGPDAPLGGLAAEVVELAEEEDDGRVRELIAEHAAELIQETAWKNGSYNLATPEGRAAKWRAMMEESKPFEDEFEELVRDVFVRIEQSILKKLENASLLTQVVADPEDERARTTVLDTLWDPDEWEADFRAAYRAVAPKAVLDSVVKSVAEMNIDIGFDVHDPRITVFVQSQSFNFVRNIDDTTKSALADMLDEALAKGTPTAVFRAQIENKFAEYQGHRAVAIARTEMGIAENYGSQFALEEAVGLGMKAKKMWISARDNRVRDSHIAADGQVVRVDQAFVVGRCRMLYPMDGARCSDPGEIVMCRCRTVPIILGK
jgi:hypothetical protein